jgi:hypothetical protein
MFSFDDYSEAEETADSLAQARGGRWAIVERFNEADGLPFAVMPLGRATAYVETHDAEVQYQTGAN